MAGGVLESVLNHDERQNGGHVEGSKHHLSPAGWYGRRYLKHFTPVVVTQPHSRDAQTWSPIGAISDERSFRLAPAFKVERGWSPNLRLGRPLKELSDGVEVFELHWKDSISMLRCKKKGVAEETEQGEIDSTNRHNPRSRH